MYGGVELRLGGFHAVHGHGVQPQQAVQLRRVRRRRARCNTHTHTHTRDVTDVAALLYYIAYVEFFNQFVSIRLYFFYVCLTNLKNIFL